MLQRGRDQPRHLGHVVPASQPNRIRRARQLAKSSAWPASKLPPAAPGCASVLRATLHSGAPDSRGSASTCSRIGSSGPNRPRRKGSTKYWCLSSRPHAGRAGPVGDQVPQVVQQAGGDQFGAGVVALGQRGGLQRVAQVADGLAVVGAMSAFKEQLLDVLQGQGHGCLLSGRKEALDGRAQPAAGAISRKRDQLHRLALAQAVQVFVHHDLGALDVERGQVRMGRDFARGIRLIPRSLRMACRIDSRLPISSVRRTLTPACRSACSVSWRVIEPGSRNSRACSDRSASDTRPRRASGGRGA